MKKYLNFPVRSTLQKIVARYLQPDPGLFLIATLMAFTTLGIAVWSIQKADWVRPEPLLIVTLAGAAIYAIILSLFRLRNIYFVILTLLSGLLITVLQSVSIFTSGPNQSALELWWQIVSNARPSDAPLYFVMFLFLVVWILGSISFYALWRFQNSWVTIICGIMMLLVNLSNLTENQHFYFPLLLISSILLLLINQNIRQKQILKRRGTALSPYRFPLIGIVAAIILSVGLGTTFFVPVPPLENISLNIDTSKFELRDQWFNVFSPISAKWPTIRSRENESLRFSDGIPTGNTPLFMVASPQSNYWKVRSYDVYESTGWSSNTTSSDAFFTDFSTLMPIPYGTDFTYTVESLLRTDVIIVPGKILEIDIPYRYQIFTGNIDNSTPDIASFTAVTMIRPNEKYTVTTRINSPGTDDLRSAGISYPHWIPIQYLQLPDDYPETVTALSQEITRDLSNPYDKAMAIKEFLSQFEYDLNTPPPPSHSDGVEHFVFVAERGYCTHFASAMATMLRAVEVPSRLATGYLRGEFDDNSQKYILRNLNYHAWVEIYFPAIGWVDFEATPATAEPLPAENDQPELNGFFENFAFSSEDLLPPWMMEMEFPPDLPVPAIPATGRFPTTWLYLIILAGMIILTIQTIKILMNHRVEKLKTIDSPSDIFQTITGLTKQVNIEKQRSETLSEFGKKLSHYLPGQESNITIITSAYRKQLYGREKQLDTKESLDLQKAWISLCPVLFIRLLSSKKMFLLRLFWKPQ